MNKKQLVSFAAPWLAICFSAAGQSGPSEIVELSPFVINASADKGYEGTHTLSGTRLSTPTRYVGAASFEVTATLMDDLGLTNMQDLVNFTPNASSYAGGGITSDTTGNSGIFGVQYNVRGITITTVNRDFLNYRVPDDAYNIERFSFTRGPNSILFGIGQPGGVVNSISKRADLYKNTYQVSSRFDTNESRRYAADLNQVLLRKKLSFRAAALTENAKTIRRPSDREATRLYGTVTFMPTPTTSIRVNGEHGRLNSLVVRPWIASDGTIDWVAKGRKEVPAEYLNGGVNYAQLPGAPAGSPSATVNRNALIALGFEALSNLARPLFAYDNSGRSPTAVINSNGFIITGRPTQPNGDRFQSWAVNPPIPYVTNVLGYGNRLIQNLNNYLVNVEQRVGPNLHIEGTFARRLTHNVNNYSSGVDDNLYLDKNPTYLSWDGKVMANPNYNRYFTVNLNSQGYLQRYNDETARVTTSYELDLRDGGRGWLSRLLGHHKFAALGERSTGGFQQDYFVLANTSPQLVSVPQFTAANQNTPLSNNNRTNFINYITLGDDVTYAPRDFWGQFPGFIYDGSALPPPNPSGITPAWTASTSTRSRQTIGSLMAVAQNFFWDDKVVTTFGLRRDTSDLWNLANLINPVTDRVINAGTRNLYSGTNLRFSGNTYTQGIVVTPVPWLGVFYNRSNSFVPPTGVRVDLFGNPLGSGDGEGQDYGLKVYMFKGKVTGTISRYTTAYKGVVTGVFRGGSTSLLPAEVAIMTAMNDATQGGPGGTYWSGIFPWPAGNLSYSSLNDIDGRGYEISLSANPTSRLRLTTNFSHQRTVSTNFGGTEARWVEEVAFGYFNAHPQYLGLRTGAGPQGSNETIAQRLEDMRTVLSLAQSLNGTVDARQAQYSGNFIAGYDFAQERIRGLSVGGTFQWRSKMIIGYPFVLGRTDLFQTDKPYYSDSTRILGAWARYELRIKKTRITLQLNVNGLNNDNGIHPYTMMDSGTSKPIVERYIVGPGRNYAFQSTFAF